MNQKKRKIFWDKQRLFNYQSKPRWSKRLLLGMLFIIPILWVYDCMPSELII